MSGTHFPLPVPPEQIVLGALALSFLPDGDDPGTGIVALETRSGYRAATVNGVSREEWDEACEATR